MKGADSDSTLSFYTFLNKAYKAVKKISANNILSFISRALIAKATISFRIKFY